jgi:hypothetical protein
VLGAPEAPIVWGRDLAVCNALLVLCAAMASPMGPERGAARSGCQIVNAEGITQDASAYRARG